jgi:hypothetical protein
MVARRALPNLSKVGEPQGAQWELWSALPITTTAALIALPAWRDRLYWSGAALVALLVCSLMRGHEGGYLNVLIPGYYVLALLPALLSARADALAANAPDYGARAPLRWAPHGLAVLVAAQLVQGRDDLRRFLPSPADAEQHAELVDDVAALPGPVLIPHAPWLAVQAGHPPSVALIALWDIDHEGGPFVDGVSDFRKALAEGYWASAVMPDARIGRGFPQAYARARSLRVQSVPTRTGWHVRLKEVWMPRVADVPLRDPRPLEPATTSP